MYLTGFPHMEVIEQKTIETDVFIVGAGPAGLVTGIAARRKGFHVVIADSARPPIDKACGEGLMPDALAVLKRLGAALPVETGVPFMGIRFIGQKSRASSGFPYGTGLGIRRTTLHENLVQSAYDAGVSIRWGTNVQRSSDGNLLADASPVSSRWIIGADGQKSRVREWAGIESYAGESVRFGFRCHFSIQPWTNHVEVYWGPECQIVVTPIGLSEICVASLTRNSGVGFDAALSLFPELKRRLVGSIRSSSLRGALSVHRRLRDVANGKYILVGDSSGSVDAITGEGLCLSFREAECLAEALAQNDLNLYRKAHRRIRRVPSLMAQLMLLMDKSPTINRTTLHLFETYPKIFYSFLATHLRAEHSESKNQCKEHSNSDSSEYIDLVNTR